MHHPGLRSAPRVRLPWGDWQRAAAPIVVLGACLSTTACNTVMSAAATEAVGALANSDSESDIFGETRAEDAGSSDRDAVASVYVRGPVPGWEAGPRPTPSASHSALFEVDLFGGSCPGLNIDRSSSGDVFGSESSLRVDLFDFQSDDRVNADYAPFGRVWLTAQEAPETTWQTTGLWGVDGGVCAFAGVPLFTFGPKHGGGFVLR